MRTPSATDFPVDVPGVGRFIFARRKMSDEVDVQREFARILGGVEPTAWLEIVGTWIAVFKVLTVVAPSDWNVDEMDPLDNDVYEKMKRVYDAFRDKELSFRGKSIPSGEGTGT